MTFSQLKRNARQALKSHWTSAVLLTFILFWIVYGLCYLLEIWLVGNPITWFLHYFLRRQIPNQAYPIEIVYSLLIAPVVISSFWFCLALVRGEDPEIKQVFYVFSELKAAFKLVWVSIVRSVFLGLWFLLLVIPGIIKSLSYAMTYFVLKDHPDYSASEAITESRQLMKGYKGDLFLLLLSFIGWGLLSLLTLGIGLLWLVPYVGVTLAEFYQQRVHELGAEIPFV
ncbi:MAG: DUF975 family protein [Sporolactobacillus sp.]